MVENGQAQYSLINSRQPAFTINGADTDLWHPALTLFYIVAIYALAVLVRLAFLDAMGIDGGYWIFPDDPPYHLRRALLTLEDWPRVPYADSYINFPSAGIVYWPPGMAWLLAGISKYFGATGAHDKQIVETVAIYLPPLIGAAVAPLTYFLARTTLSQILALLCAIIVGVAPAVVGNSLPTRFDHHFLEPTLITGLTLAVILATVHHSQLARFAWCVIGGATIGVALLFWPGVLLYLILFTAATLVACVLLPHNGHVLARVGLYTFLLAIPFTIVVIISMPWAQAAVFYAPSWLHVWVLFVATTCFAGLAFAPREHTALVVTVAVVAVLLTGIAIPAIRTALLDGIAYVLDNPFKSGISELDRPLDSPYRFIADITWVAILSPILAIVLILSARKIDASAQPTCGDRITTLTPYSGVLLACVSMAFVIPALTASRWGQISVSFAVIVTIAGSASLARTRISNATKRSVLLVTIASILLMPSLYALTQLRAAPATMKTLERHLAKIRLLTPPASADEFDPRSLPTYGALTPWWLGHIFTYNAGIPTLGNNFFGTPFYDEPNLQTYRHYLNTDCGDAASKLTQNKLRHVLILAQQGDPENIAQIAEAVAYTGPVFTTAAGRISAFGQQTLIMRLAGRAGSAYSVVDTDKKITTIPGCGRFRLVSEAYLSGATDGPGQSRLFEIVPGAMVTGHAPPSSLVLADVAVQSAIGRSFTWKNLARADAAGEFSIRVPYATNGACVHRVHDNIKCEVYVADSGYEIYINGEPHTQVSVQESDVMNGRQVTID